MKTTLRIIAAACIASGTFFTSAAHADFSGSYAAGTTTTTPAGPPGAIGQTPSALTMAPSSSAINTNYFFTAPMSGLVSFTWSYLTTDPSVGADPFSYLYNNTPTLLAASVGGPFSLTGGNISFAVNTGDTFGWRLGSNGVANITTATITNFSGPVPEPETYLLMGLGALGLAYARRRQQKNKDQAQAPQMEPVSA